MVGRAPCGMPHVLALSSQPLHMFARHENSKISVGASKIGGVDYVCTRGCLLALHFRICRSIDTPSMARFVMKSCNERRASDDQNHVFEKRGRKAARTHDYID